jgi:hypothetical protein
MWNRVTGGIARASLNHRLMAANPAGLVSENENRAQPCHMDLKSLMQPWSAAEPMIVGLQKGSCSGSR